MNTGYEKNAPYVMNEKLQILYSLIAHQYQEMAIILNVKSAVLVLFKIKRGKRKNKEDDTYG